MVKLNQQSDGAQHNTSKHSCLKTVGDIQRHVVSLGPLCVRCKRGRGRGSCPQ